MIVAAVVGRVVVGAAVVVVALVVTGRVVTLAGAVELGLVVSDVVGAVVFSTALVVDGFFVVRCEVVGTLVVLLALFDVGKLSSAADLAVVEGTPAISPGSSSPSAASGVELAGIIWAEPVLPIGSPDLVLGNDC